MWRWTLRILAGLAGVAAIAVVTLLIVGRPSVEVSASPTALVQVHVGGLGTRVDDVVVTRGATPVEVTWSGDRLTPMGKLPAGTALEVHATVASPGWLAWLVGRSASTSVRLVTPEAHTRSAIALVSASHTLPVRFSTPVVAVAYRVGGPGTPTALARVSPPSNLVELPVPADAGGGTLEVAGLARAWEAPPAPHHTVAWFASIAAQRVGVIAQPAPSSTTASSASPITLVFSQTVAQALGAARPRISPTLDGSWREQTPHELVFTPSGFGYGPGTTVTVRFPRVVDVVGAGANVSSYSFTVRAASVLRLEQLLAQLHYLPLRFTPAAGVATPTTMATEEATMYAPLPGSFSWRYPNVPPSLAAQWDPGTATVLVKGALMAFEATQPGYDGYTLDGESVAQIAGASTWRALLEAATTDTLDPRPYSYVYVTKTLPETLTLWEDGHVVLTSLANTGIPQDPTADGTYPIYVRYVENYMSGTNPNGTRYDDLVHWINYFNGGDAVHGFVRATYGFPQSLGCVELPVATAAVVFPHLAIGDLVTVAN